MIPEFDLGGNLPPGVHTSTWALFVTRFGITDHRRRLISGLKGALDSLKRAGCRRAFVDGSFVTGKEQPRGLRRLLGPGRSQCGATGPDLAVLREPTAPAEDRFFRRTVPVPLAGERGGAAVRRILSN